MSKVNEMSQCWSSSAGHDRQAVHWTWLWGRFLISPDDAGHLCIFWFLRRPAPTFPPQPLGSALSFWSSPWIGEHFINIFFQQSSSQHDSCSPFSTFPPWTCSIVQKWSCSSPASSRGNELCTWPPPGCNTSPCFPWSSPHSPGMFSKPRSPSSKLIRLARGFRSSAIDFSSAPSETQLPLPAIWS